MQMVDTVLMTAGCGGSGCGAHLRPARVVREVCGVICTFSETLCQKLVIFILENIHINVTARRGRPIICTNNLSISCLSDKESDQGAQIVL